MWERIRRVAAWVAGFCFAVSFGGLLVLSATHYWVPGNEMVLLCDRVWKVSAIAAVCLGVLPYLVRAGRRAAGLFADVQ